jgi:lysophospholipase L1-like esterase
MGPPPFRRWPPALHDRVPYRPGRFEGEIRAFEHADDAAPPPAGAVLFVGSSSIKHWKSLQDDFEGVPVLNRGFGGSQMEDVVHYAKRIILPYRARRIVVYAGDNDLHAGKSPREVFADFRSLVDLIRRRQPRTPIAFLAIKPSPARWGKVERVREANELIHDYCEEHPYLEYIDGFTPMLGRDGRPRPELYARDGLHLSPAGYAAWAEELSVFVRASRGPVAMGSARDG